MIASFMINIPAGAGVILSDTVILILVRVIL